MPQIIQYSNADTACLQSGGNSNYGTSQNMSIDSSGSAGRFGAVNFNLTTLPANVRIDSATLEVIKYSGAATAMNLRADRFTSSWTETGMTWNNAPAATNDGNPTTYISANATYSLNVTKSVQAWADGAGIFGLKLVPTSGSLTYFRSREYSWISVKLTINYTEIPNMQVNVGDSWRAPSQVYVNVGDVWRTVPEAWVNVGDAWRKL